VPIRKLSVRPPPDAPRSGNKLIACLPPEDFARLQPYLKTVRFKRKEVIHRRNEPTRRVVFPNGGVASVTTAMKSGAMVEIATVGDEGLLGLEAFFGDAAMPSETMIQVSDIDTDTNAEVMTADAFRQEMNRAGPFQACVLRYWQGFQTLIMQSTACMALHPVHERCCRWLLMAHDRVRRDEFQLSHEFLAMMLGTTRPTVTVVAGTLQKAGLIHYRHGHMTILDRHSLEEASCECYGTVKAQFDRLGL
jgi:CRP-like cAMP-binding protein